MVITSNTLLLIQHPTLTTLFVHSYSKLIQKLLSLEIKKKKRKRKERKSITAKTCPSMLSDSDDNYIDEVGMIGLNAQEIQSVESLKLLIDSKTANSDRLNILCMNIRSINCNFDQFIKITEQLLDKIDVLVFSEAWLLKNNFPENAFKIEGFKSFFTKNNKNQNDGVAVFTRDMLDCEINELTMRASTGCKIRVRKENSSFSLFVFYRPPELDVNLFLEDMEELLLLNKHSSDSILMGDINIDIREDCDVSHRYKLLMGTNAFLCCNELFTRIQGKQKSCLDHIFCRTAAPKNFQSFVLRNSLTDHDWTVASIKLDNNNIKPEKYNGGNKVKVKKINHNKLKTLLHNENWTSVLDFKEVNGSLKKFDSILNNCIAQASYEITLNKRKIPIKPWITEAILVSIRNRDKLKLKTNHNPLDEGLSLKYRKYRNLLNDMEKKAKNYYFNGQLRGAHDNVRKKWKILREAANLGDRKTKNIISKLTVENDEISFDKDPKKICNTLNRHFTTIGAKTAAKCSTSKRSNNFFKVSHSNKAQPNSLFFEPVTAAEVESFIRSLRGGCAPGLDNYSVELLKEIAEYIIKPLEHIFNTSLTTGIFPSRFKESKVIPLFKKGDTKVVSNYRPISLTSNLAKILEKIVKKRLSSFLEKYKILSNNQYGFRKSVSTQNAVADLVTEILREIDQGNKPVLILLDIEKAFDTITHNKLLNKLETVGVRGVPLRWFQSYVSDRKQIVMMGDILSETMYYEVGLPQGTVLSPILFLIYINELCNMNVQGKVFSFADDTALLVTAESWEQAYKKASVEISKIYYWLEDNLLKMNITKTKYITFSANSLGQPNETLKITIHSNTKNTYQCLSNQCSDCENQEKFSNAKYLRVQLDQHLKWDVHIGMINKKLRSLTFFFKIIAKFASIDFLREVYYGLVQSILQYCVIVWGRANTTHLEPLFLSQKCILKILSGKPKRYSTALLFK